MASATLRYRNPVDVRFGVGSLALLPEVLRGRPAVVITFPEAEATGLLPTVRSLLGAQLRGIITDIEPNPGVAWVEAHYADFWSRYSDAVVVAIGGGSTIDSAKALLSRPPSGTFAETLVALRAGQTPPTAQALPLISIPTTAGTGSEVTPWATLWDRTAATPTKLSFHTEALWSEIALVDPALTLTLPDSVTRVSALDALSHALESIWNLNANPVSDALAVEAAGTLIATLPSLLADPRDLALRTEVSRASLLAGLAFSNTKTALAHAISYPLTLRYGVPHGIACSFTLPLVWSMAQGVSPARDAVLAEIFGPQETNPTGALRSFLESVGVDCGFGAYGVSPAEAAAILRNAAGGARGQNFINTQLCANHSTSS